MRPLTRPTMAPGVRLPLLVLGAWMCVCASVFGQSAPQGDDRPVILAIGESTTAGYGVDRDLSYPGQLQRELDARGYRYRVVNHGVSGSTTADALTRMDRGVALFPKIVIIALGGNDGGGRVTAPRTRANLDKLVSMFTRIGAKVFIADREIRTSDTSQTVVSEVAAAHHAVLMPPLLADVSGHPDLLIEDGRHPNAAGYAIVVGHLLPILEPHLKR